MDLKKVSLSISVIDFTADTDMNDDPRDARSLEHGTF